MLMLGGAMAGSGIEKALALVLSEVRALRLAVAGVEGGGGAAMVGMGGRVVSGAGGGACATSLETAPSPVDWKSGGSTYLLKSTFPPKRTMTRRWIRAETVRNREARIGRRNRSKWDLGWSGICSERGKGQRVHGADTPDKSNVNGNRESVEQK